MPLQSSPPQGTRPVLFKTLFVLAAHPVSTVPLPCSSSDFTCTEQTHIFFFILIWTQECPTVLFCVKTVWFVLFCFQSAGRTFCGLLLLLTGLLSSTSQQQIFNFPKNEIPEFLETYLTVVDGRAVSEGFSVLLIRSFETRISISPVSGMKIA